MTAKLDPETSFVEGIFNYCDRWCERCTMTSRCLLFSMESKRRADHVSTGEDPDDLDTVLNDVRTTLQQTKEMILQEVSARGIELEELEEEECVRVDTSTHPLHVSAKALSFRIHHFREHLGKILNEEADKETRIEHLSALQDAFEILAWYEFQFFVKIQRALPPVITNAKYEELYDANGSAKVAWIGLTRCLDALTRIAEILPWMHQEVLPLLNNTYQSIDLLDHTIPGHKAFNRPGFDD
jgi:hypothetical protein